MTEIELLEAIQATLEITNWLLVGPVTGIGFVAGQKTYELLWKQRREREF